MNSLHRQSAFTSPRHQRGVATLLVALVLLVILTLIVLGSSNVALFEQKTTTNEGRQHLAEQAAEYYLNLGGEYLKANVVNIASNEDVNGWLTAGASLRWQLCPANPVAGHPCSAVDATTRPNMYYYTSDGAAHTTATATELNLPYGNVIPSGGRLAAVDNGTFAVTGRVRALLCRLDTSTGAAPSCQATPTTGNRIAITLIADTSLDNENSAAQVKETWGTYTSFTTIAAVPLVASGFVKGLGDGSIVASANAGGYGLPASIWSPNNVDVDGSAGGGVGSVSTCHLGNFLGSVPSSALETTCAGQGNTGCSCANVAQGSPDMLSGHYGGSYKQESLDVLDIDSNHGVDSGNGPPIDIAFFPGKTSAGRAASAGPPVITAIAPGTRMDHQAVGGVCPAAYPYCLTDDNLFEWIFGEDVNGGDNDGYPVSGGSGTWRVNAAIATAELAVLDDKGAQHIPDCSSANLNTTSSGLYYVEGACDLKVDVGSIDNQVIVVADGAVKVNGNFNFFGMLFVRDAASGASLKGTGNDNFFGAVVVEGDVDIAGNFTIIYVNTSTGTPGKKLPPTTRFARLPGSWLDSQIAF